jgi:hypothetical protein
MAELPLFGPPPERALCQHQGGGCAACCGLYNFVDRTPAAEHARLLKRTRAVRAAMPAGVPDRSALRTARDALLAEETPHHVTSAIKVCPFAGYLDDDLPKAPGQGRVGCMIHPLGTRDGEDHRDLAVYDRATCAGHFCASHDWLRPPEAEIAQTVGGTLYGRVVTDAGLVKALRALVEERLGRRLRAADVTVASSSFAAAFRGLLETWPWASRDPRRFGGVVVDDDDIRERTVSTERFGRELARPMRTLLDAAATEVSDDAQLDAALAAIDALVNAIASAIDAD